MCSALYITICSTLYIDFQLKEAGSRLGSHFKQIYNVARTLLKTIFGMKKYILKSTRAVNFPLPEKGSPAEKLKFALKKNFSVENWALACGSYDFQGITGLHCY